MAMMKGSQVEFQIGDNVREGMHVGTVTDVGTVLIQVKTTDGRLRVVCPWELVRTRHGCLGPECGN
jgi:small-conductance mechanosensitive channel